MYLRIILLVFLAFATIDSSGQFWNSKKKAEKEAAANHQPTSLNPSYLKNEAAPKTARKASKGPTYGLEEQFYDRMAELEKTRRKNERLMEKPQYSNPLYFGHKRPPKKRKPSKMKYCKECGIRH
jgi:hypothetical protein